MLVKTPTLFLPVWAPTTRGDLGAPRQVLVLTGQWHIWVPLGFALQQAGKLWSPARHPGTALELCLTPWDSPGALPSTLGHVGSCPSPCPCPCVVSSPRLHLTLLLCAESEHTLLSPGDRWDPLNIVCWQVPIHSPMLGRLSVAAGHQCPLCHVPAGAAGWFWNERRGKLEISVTSSAPALVLHWGMQRDAGWGQRDLVPAGRM